MIEDFLRCALFIDLSFIHIENLSSDFPDEFHVMRHNDHCRSALSQPFDRIFHFANHRGIQSAGRFIKQDDFRIHNQCTGDRNSLFLPAGQLIRHPHRMLIQPDFLQCVQCMFSGCLFINLKYIQLRYNQVIQNGHIVEQVKTLKDHTDFTPQARHVITRRSNLFLIEKDLSARWCFQSVDHPQ